MTNKINEDPIYEEYVNLCKTIVTPSRIMIIETIGDQKLNVSEIQSRLNMSMSNLSNHLNALQLAGVLGKEKKGNYIYYYLVEPELIKVFEKMRSIVHSITSNRGKKINKPISNVD
jgi:DNA-binding transcriptional ArsR family regulator